MKSSVATLEKVPGGVGAIAAMRRATHVHHEFQRMKEKLHAGLPSRADDELCASEMRRASERMKRLLESVVADDLQAIDAARQALIGGPGRSDMAILNEKPITEFKLARAVAGISEEAKRATLLIHLQNISMADANSRGDIVRKARASGFGKIINLWSSLASHAPQSEVILEWASERLESIRSQFIDELNIAIARTENQLAAISTQSQAQEAASEKERRKQREALSAYEGTYRRAVQDAFTHQWELGPRFLMAVEEFCREQHGGCMSVPLDPPRMVGWKLWSLGIPVTVQDLHEKAKKILGNTVGMEAISRHGPENANGSYVTDYVHFVASQQIGKDPREITSLFLQELLRPSELASIFSALHEIPPSSGSEVEVVDRLLTVLGWSAEEARTERSLAGCINKERERWFVLSALSSNEIRIVAESFCKDMIDLMATNLGHTEAELWEDVLTSHAHYK